MPAVSKKAKAHIAQRLAWFDTPSQVVTSVKERFGLDIARQSVEAYDPTKRAGRSLTAEYTTAFMAERKAFLANTAGVGIASKVVRLRNLQRLYNQAEGAGNFTLAARILAQAAREMGQDRR